MVSFMKRHSQPVVTTLASASDVVGFSTKDRVTVVGYFDEEDNASKSAFSDTANMHRDKFLFGTVSDDVFGGVEGVKKPSIVLYKAFDEGKNVYAEALHTEKIDGFLAEATTPLIREVGVDLTFFPSNVSITRGFYAHVTKSSYIVGW